MACGESADLCSARKRHLTLKRADLMKQDGNGENIAAKWRGTWRSFFICSWSNTPSSGKSTRTYASSSISGLERGWACHRITLAGFAPFDPHVAISLDCGMELPLESPS